MDAELPNYKTGINRDVFVFCAFTGLSHSDVAKLPHTDIHTDDNRDRWIIDKDRKTGTQFRVKLLPVAEMINDRYKDLHLEGNKVFPIKSYYRTMNMSLRQVARHAGLPFNPTRHMARQGHANRPRGEPCIFPSPAFCWTLPSEKAAFCGSDATQRAGCSTARISEL